MEAFAAAAALEADGDAVPTSGAYGRLVGNKRFRRLWYAQFVSGIGDWLVIGLLMPIVLSLSGGSSFAVAGIFIAKIIPALVLSSFTGAIVDRYDRRKVMIAADLSRAVLAVALLFTNSLWAIYLIVLLMETASLFFWPARNSLIPYLVEEDDIVAANGLSYTTQQASMLVGLLASAGILAAFEAVVRWTIDSGLPIAALFAGLFEPALATGRGGVILDVFTFLFSAGDDLHHQGEGPAVRGPRGRVRPVAAGQGRHRVVPLPPRPQGASRPAERDRGGHPRRRDDHLGGAVLYREGEHASRRHPDTRRRARAAGPGGLAAHVRDGVPRPGHGPGRAGGAAIRTPLPTPAAVRGKRRCLRIRDAGLREREDLLDRVPVHDRLPAPASPRSPSQGRATSCAPPTTPSAAGCSPRSRA